MNVEKKEIVAQEILSESCRSVSDPDLVSSLDKERSSVSSGEGDGGEGGRNSRTLSTNGHNEVMRNGRQRLPYNVRYSDNSLDRSEVNTILDGLQNMSGNTVLPGERPSTNASSSGAPTYNTAVSKLKGVISKSKGKHKTKEKKLSIARGFQSSENLEKDCRNSSSTSPQDVEGPFSKKKSSTGKLKNTKKKNSKSIIISSPIIPPPSPQEEPFTKEVSFSPPGQPDPSVVDNEGQGLVNGHASPSSATSDDASPKHIHVVSNPIGVKQQLETDSHFNLQTLVQPVNKSWLKCGYLWLRMKLPNLPGRYAWTHIVSDCFPCSVFSYDRV